MADDSWATQTDAYQHGRDSRDAEVAALKAQLAFAMEGCEMGWLLAMEVRRRNLVLDVQTCARLAANKRTGNVAGWKRRGRQLQNQARELGAKTSKGWFRMREKLRWYDGFFDGTFSELRDD